MSTAPAPNQEAVATRQIQFRLEEDLVKRLDDAAARLTRELGFPVKRTDVVKRFINEGLARLEQDPNGEASGGPSTKRGRP